MINLALIIFLAFAGTSLAGGGTFLQYQTERPVIMRSSAKIELAADAPEIGEMISGEQKLEALLTVTSGDESGVPVSSVPLDLFFTLRSLSLDICADGEKIYFSTAEEEDNGSFYRNQLSTIIDRTIKLRIENTVPLEFSCDDLEKIAAYLPLLREIDPRDLLRDIIAPVFAFCGEKLFVGKKMEEMSGFCPFVGALEYRIEKIDNYDVYASIKGVIDAKKALFDLDGAQFSGTVSGDIRFNRDNAMLFDLTLDYHYSIVFRLGNKSHKANFVLKINNVSSLY